MEKAKQVRKAYKMLVIETFIERHGETTEAKIYHRRGDFYGDSREDALEWFKSIMPPIPKGTSRSSIIIDELNLPERKNVRTKGYWQGYLLGAAMWLAYAIIVHFFKI